jgi:hypothetical protein
VPRIIDSVKTNADAPRRRLPIPLRPCNSFARWLPPDEELKHEPALNAQRLAALDDALRFTGQGVLELDRPACGSTYGSGKLFRFLGPHVVNDHIHLHVEIHAEWAT